MSRSEPLNPQVKLLEIMLAGDDQAKADKPRQQPQHGRPSKTNKGSQMATAAALFQGSIQWYNPDER